MTDINDQELQASATPGYNPGQKKTLEEYTKLDQHDEWKASLGIGQSQGSSNGPKIELLTLSLISSTRPDPITFDLKDFTPTQSKESKETFKKNPVNIKEGIEYNVKVDFKVNHDVISGLRYIQVVKRAGMTVDKLEEMLGSYGPNNVPYSKTFLPEESPSGMLARSGSYNVRSRIVDDDHNIYLDFEWSFKLSKEW